PCSITARGRVVRLHPMSALGMSRVGVRLWDQSACMSASAVLKIDRRADLLLPSFLGSAVCQRRAREDRPERHAQPAKDITDTAVECLSAAPVKRHDANKGGEAGCCGRAGDHAPKAVIQRE